ncbi:NADH dehydrogenase [ubiquinone] 1 alpha subcomplex subunit 8 [Madurella mycetomatis]|uniref:NADH dehydrogenase [ubiquinone] 1 alpha subcomplex subunit 8 n=1 Tax=Madurella mycetomatis TaxID=100816 RepID=A0A175WGZ3_9PEZI|nr:NADH dehydrogenase [ubiquinone] 1 alpha subcomplex subunit 8 [Madurella mycetomatis]
MAARKPVFNQHVLLDTTPLPDSIPKVKEIGSSSAPLLSASFFIGARCRDYNDDYMQCKTQNPGKGEFECLKEGRRVTRCARSVYVVRCSQFPMLNISDLLERGGGGRQEHWWLDLVVQMLTVLLSSLEDINKSCLEQFRTHWQCLENNNQQLWQCRPAEWKLNKCVYENLKLEKVIPDQPEKSTPVHLRTKQIFSHSSIPPWEKPFIPEKTEGAKSS